MGEREGGGMGGRRVGERVRERQWKEKRNGEERREGKDRLREIEEG